MTECQLAARHKQVVRIDPAVLLPKFAAHLVVFDAAHPIVFDADRLMLNSQWRVDKAAVRNNFFNQVF